MLSGVLSIVWIINHIGATERKPQLMDFAEANNGMCSETMQEVSHIEVLHQM